MPSRLEGEGVFHLYARSTDPRWLELGGEVLRVDSGGSARFFHSTIYDLSGVVLARQDVEMRFAHLDEAPAEGECLRSSLDIVFANGGRSEFAGN